MSNTLFNFFVNKPLDFLPIMWDNSVTVRTACLGVDVEGGRYISKLLIVTVKPFSIAQFFRIVKWAAVCCSNTTMVLGA